MYKCVTYKTKIAVLDKYWQLGKNIVLQTAVTTHLNTIAVTFSTPFNWGHVT